MGQKCHHDAGHGGGGGACVFFEGWNGGHPSFLRLSYFYFIKIYVPYRKYAVIQRQQSRVDTATLIYAYLYSLITREDDGTKPAFIHV